MSSKYRDFFKWIKYQCAIIPALAHEDKDGKRIYFETNVDAAEYFTVEKAKSQSYCVVVFYPKITPGENFTIRNEFLVFVGFWGNSTADELAIATAMDKSYALTQQLIVRLNQDEEQSRHFLGVSGLEEGQSAVPVEMFYKDYSGYLWTVQTAHHIPTCDNLGVTPNDIYL